MTSHLLPSPGPCTSKALSDICSDDGANPGLKEPWWDMGWWAGGGFSVSERGGNAEFTQMDT